MRGGLDMRLRRNLNDWKIEDMESLLRRLHRVGPVQGVSIFGSGV